MKKIFLIIIALTLMTVPVNAASKLSKPSISCKSTGYNSIQISWKAVKGASSYRIYRSTSTKSNSFKKVATVKTTSYDNKGLSFNKKCYYKVKAVGTGKYKTSNYSSRKYATTKLSAPQITVKSVVGGPEISWPAVNGATMYAIYRKEGSKFIRIVDTFETSYNIDESIKEKDYSYAVKACRRVKTYKTVKGKKVAKYTEYYSDYSKTESGRNTLNAETPIDSLSAPVISVSENSTSATVSWTDVKGATKYTVSCGSFFKETLGTSVEITGLKAGTSYVVKVTATDGVTNSAGQKTFTTATSSVNKPYDVSAAASYESEYNDSVATCNNESIITSYNRGIINVSWKGNADNYKITCTGTTKTDGSSVKYEGTTSSNSYKFTKVANHCNYTITIIPDGNTSDAAVTTVYVDDSLTPEKGFPVVTNYSMKYGNAEFHLGQQWSNSLLSQIASGSSGYDIVHLNKYYIGGHEAQEIRVDNNNTMKTVWLKNYRNVSSNDIYDVDVYTIDNEDYDHYIEVWVANNQIIAWYSAEDVLGYINGKPIARGTDRRSFIRYAASRITYTPGLVKWVDSSIPENGYKDYMGGFEAGMHLADDRGQSASSGLTNSEWKLHHPDAKNSEEISRLAANTINLLRARIGMKPYILLNEMREQTFTGTITAMFRGKDPAGEYDSITVNEERTYENQRYGSQVWAETMEASGILGDLGTLNHSKVTQGPMGQISGDAMDKMMAAGNSPVNKYQYDGCISKTGYSIGGLTGYSTVAHYAFMLGITKNSAGDYVQSEATAISFGQINGISCMFAYRPAK